jgi:hypothetical protein
VDDVSCGKLSDARVRWQVASFVSNSEPGGILISLLSSTFAISIQHFDTLTMHLSPLGFHRSVMEVTVMTMEPSLASLCHT